MASVLNTLSAFPINSNLVTTDGSRVYIASGPEVGDRANIRAYNIASGSFAWNLDNTDLAINSPIEGMVSDGTYLYLAVADGTQGRIYKYNTSDGSYTDTNFLIDKPGGTADFLYASFEVIISGNNLWFLYKDRSAAPSPTRNFC